MSTPQEDAARAYRSGADLAELAAEHGVSVRTVRRWLDAQGVQRRPAGRPVTIDREQVVRMRHTGASWAEIGAALDPPVTGEAVRRAYLSARRTVHDR